eukprot:g21281.t1
MSEIPNDSTDSTFQIAWASLADLSYQKNWISTGEANRKRDKELEELEVRKCASQDLREFPGIGRRDLYRFALAIWRDETMRLDFLLRDQLQAQRRKLKVENEKSEDLLKSMLPQAIIDSLKRHEPVECQDFQNVTVIFVQVCDFSVMCSVLPATTIVQLLDKVFQELDRLSDLLKVHKVETVGDVYMAVSGCPHEIANHADVAAHFAIAAQSSILRMRASDVILPQGRLDFQRLGWEGIPVARSFSAGLPPHVVLTWEGPWQVEPFVEPPTDSLNQIRRATKRSAKRRPRAAVRLNGVIGALRFSRPVVVRSLQLRPSGADASHFEVRGRLAGAEVWRRAYERRSCGIGELVLGRWEGDGQYYYARILASHAQAATVLWIDRDPSHRLVSWEHLVTPEGAACKAQQKATLGLGQEEWLDMARRTKAFDELAFISPSTSVHWILGELHVSAARWAPDDVGDESIRADLTFTIAKKGGNVTGIYEVLGRLEPRGRGLNLEPIPDSWKVQPKNFVMVGTQGVVSLTDDGTGDWEQYRLGVQARTWGVQVCGWVHLGLLMDKASFDHRGRLITVGMLALEGAAMADTSFFMLYGLYVLFSKNCPMRARLTLCFLSLTEWAVVDTMLCDWRLQQRAFEHVSYTTVVLLLTAAGIRMQEHLDHCANYYERHVQRQIHDISDVKRGNQKLLSMILPSHVVQMVIQDGISPIAEDYPNVSVVFTDLQGFTAFSSRISPMELVELLNLLYSAFDEIIMDWGVHKVEVIGDAYFISSGCPVEDTDAVFTADEYAMRAVEVALALQRVVPSVCDDNSVQMRCLALKGPRFHLFGPTVEYANRMESTGLPGKVQISDRTKQWLDRGGHDYIFEDRIVEIAGQEERTFLVTRSKARAARKIRTELAMHRHVSPHAYVMSAATEASEIV